MRKSSQIIILVILFVCIFTYLKTNSTETIPHEDSKAQEKLNKAITLSKFNIDDGIRELEILKDLPDYTEYKRSYILAKLQEKKGNIEGAIQAFEKLLEKNYPLKERVLFHYANLNAQKGNDALALKYFNKLLRNFPYSKSIPQAKYYLAQTQFRLKYTDAAINTLLSLKEEFPDTQFGIATNYYLGEYAYNKNNYNEALQYWRKYLELSPDGRFANEIASTIQKDKDDYSLLGDVFFHKKDYKNAAYYYKIGNNTKKFYELGYSLFRTNNKTEAEKYLREFAYTFPKATNAKWALFYASRCLPSYMRKSFFNKATKDIPELAYYTTYKEALLEESDRKREKILKEYIVFYPNSEFTLDAVWEIMWQKIKDKDYANTIDIGKKYFDLSKNTPNLKSETRAKIGFWLGKLAELTNQKDKAIEYYKQVQDLLFDNYYSIRSRNRLQALSGKNDPLWNQQFKISDFNDFIFSIPPILKQETLKRHFGATTCELINLQEYDEAVDLIGKSKSPSKKITAWLKALNNEYEESINIANSTCINYNLNTNSAIWKLAYPLYFWQYIYNNCKNYPGLDPLLVCALIRQESRFETNAKSISNAYGLMQLISPTAKTLSRQINLNLYSLDLLNDPKINISLGTFYLNGLIQDFNNPLFAVASYNAGSSSTKKWINTSKNKNDLDFFIEEIPYDETRNYVKKVFSSYWTYIQLYNK